MTLSVIRVGCVVVALATPVQEVVAQESPEALAMAFVAAIQRGDRATLASLIHAQVADYFLEHDPDRWEQVLEGWLSTQIKPDFEIVVREAADVSAYDAEAASLTWQNRLRFRFPVLPPSHFVIIRDASDTLAEHDTWVSGTNTIEAVREKDGRWKITVPAIEIVGDGPMP